MSLKQKIVELMARADVDIDLDDFGYLVSDIATMLADEIQEREPYATESISLLRAGGDTIQRHLGYLED